MVMRLSGYTFAVNQAALPPLNPQVAWSFAKLDWPTPRVLRHAGVQLAARTSAFGDKEASNVLWALASQVRDRGLTWRGVQCDVGGQGCSGIGCAAFVTGQVIKAAVGCLMAARPAAHTFSHP